MPPFRTSFRVEFCQTDAGGIMHFSEFFRLMEQAEAAGLGELDNSAIIEVLRKPGNRAKS